MRTWAFVLITGGKHFLCLERAPLTADVDAVRTEPGGEVPNNEIPWRRYSRVAESDALIVSLRGESDTHGNITLTWGENGEHTLNLKKAEWRLDQPPKHDVER